MLPAWKLNIDHSFKTHDANSASRVLHPRHPHKQLPFQLRLLRTGACTVKLAQTRTEVDLVEGALSALMSGLQVFHDSVIGLFISWAEYDKPRLAASG